MYIGEAILSQEKNRLAYMNFEEIFERVKKETAIKNTVHLAQVVGCAQPSVSGRKKQGTFPTDWAFKIAQKFGLSTDWIMTGQGSPRPDQGGHGLEIVNQIERWIQEQEKREPGALAWFTYDFRKKYPEFDRWEKREEGDSAESNAASKRNIA